MGCFDWLTLVDATRDELSGYEPLVIRPSALFCSIPYYTAGIVYNRSMYRFVVIRASKLERIGFVVIRVTRLECVVRALCIVALPFETETP